MALTPTTPIVTDSEESSFDDPKILETLIMAANGQLMLVLDYLENEQHIDVSSDPRFSAANNLTAAYLLWKMKDPSFFQMLRLILQERSVPDRL